MPGLWYNAMIGKQQHPRRHRRASWSGLRDRRFDVVDADDDRSSVRRARTATGSSTRSSPRGSASRRTRSPEDRFSDATGTPDNTTLRLADSVNLFDTGALAPDVTVDTANYRMLAFDAGMKYRGFFLQAEYYNRWLDNFDADGPLPVDSIHDTGFYVQGAFFPVPKKLELYGATSQIFGDKDAGFSHSYEVLGGVNYYVADTRNHRLNLQVHLREPLAGQQRVRLLRGRTDGQHVAVGFSVFFEGSAIHSNRLTKEVLT